VYSAVCFWKRWFIISSVWVERRFSGMVDLNSKTGISKNFRKKFGEIFGGMLFFGYIGSIKKLEKWLQRKILAN
jgi:hypothetical protein